MSKLTGLRIKISLERPYKELLNELIIYTHHAVFAQLTCGYAECSGVTNAG